MSVQTITFDETTRTTGHDDDLDHYFCCCSPDVGLCGADIAGDPVCEDGDQLELPCVVCVDLRPAKCPRCGFGSSGPCFCGQCE